MNYLKDYDICGWAVIDNMVATKGTVFKPGSLTKEKYAKVPIIFGSIYDVGGTVGSALLETVDGGIYFYGIVTEPMLNMIHSGEIQTVSIHANNIKRDVDRNVINGTIRALELVKYDEQPPEFQDTKIEKWKYDGKFFRRDENELREI